MVGRFRRHGRLRPAGLCAEADNATTIASQLRQLSPRRATAPATGPSIAVPDQARVLQHPRARFQSAQTDFEVEMANVTFSSPVMPKDITVYAIAGHRGTLLEIAKEHQVPIPFRSEERRVGKEGRSRW